MNKIIKVEITPKTILTTLAILALCWLITKIYSILFLTFIAFSISAMLSPTVDYLYSKKIPRSLSIALIYILFISTIILLILVSYRPLFTQLEEFVRTLPDLVVNVVNTIVTKVPFIRDKFNWDEILNNLKENFWANLEISKLSNYFVSGVGKAFGFVGSIFGALINVLATIIISVYFIHSKEQSKEKLLKFFPTKHKDRIYDIINKIETQLGAWLRAQLILMAIIGILGWLGLEIIGVEFSAPMGVIGGLLETIPNIGPMITWFLAVIIGIGSNLPTWKVVFIAIWFILIQQVENYIIIPKLMEKFVGTNPLLTILAVLGASRIFGVWGALLAVPAVAITQISLREYLKYKKESGT